ncbi:MAG: hypothetical protein Q8N07_04200, partial [Rhodocyclaceae bacterium]|nr:hypothetical protein [Rhodocyclaceae bacterium]
MSYQLHAVLAALAAGLLFANPLVLAQEATPDTAPAAAPLPPVVPVFTVDKTSLANGGVVTVTGQAAPGKPVYLEVFNEKPVTGSFFDSRPNKETGKIPYKLYMASEIPAFYRIHVPRETQPILDDFKK